MLLALDEIDAVLADVRVEVLDLLLAELDVLEPVGDLVVAEKALLLALGDELLELLDFGKRDVDGEQVANLPALVVARRPCLNPAPGPPAPASPEPCRILVSGYGFP